jgi:hypothetical protein
MLFPTIYHNLRHTSLDGDQRRMGGVLSGIVKLNLHILFLDQQVLYQPSKQ